MTSVLVGLLVGNAAPLTTQPTMLRSVCVCLYTVSKQSGHGLDDPPNKSPYWLRSVGGTLSVHAHFID